MAAKYQANETAALPGLVPFHLSRADRNSSPQGSQSFGTGAQSEFCKPDDQVMINLAKRGLTASILHRRAQTAERILALKVFEL